MLAEDSMDRKGKSTPKIDVYSYENKSLALPGWKVFNVVNLPRGWLVSLKNKAIQGAQHWSLLLTGWAFRGGSS